QGPGALSVQPPVRPGERAGHAGAAIGQPLGQAAARTGRQRHDRTDADRPRKARPDRPNDRHGARTAHAGGAGSGGHSGVNRGGGAPWLLLAVPLVVAVLSVPMAFDWVEPNGFYGIRTAATRASEAAWYRANRAAGQAGLLAGLIGFAINVMIMRSGRSILRKQVLGVAVLVGVTLVIVAAGSAAT